MGTRVYKYLCALSILLFSLTAFPDVMNLNELTPTLLEDATPVNEKAHVFLFSGRFNENGSSDETFFRPNYRYGASKRLQLEGQVDIKTGGNEKGGGQTKLAAMYQLYEVEKFIPVIAINPIIFLPTGKKDEGLDGQLKFNVTSTLAGTLNTPRTQAHFNYGWSLNNKRLSGERKNYNLYALGASHKVGDSTAIVGNYYYGEQLEKDEIWNLLEGGFRHEVRRNAFLGLGVGAGLTSISPHWRALLSFEMQLQ